MRAAGVPSRVVSGYRGGRVVRPLSGAPYLDIRQSDAHAWSEVWLEGQGWSRVDPTTWVQRIDASARLWSERSDQSFSAPWWRWLQWQWWGLDLPGPNGGLAGIRWVSRGCCNACWHGPATGPG